MKSGPEGRLIEGLPVLSEGSLEYSRREEVITAANVSALAGEIDRRVYQLP